MDRFALSQFTTPLSFEEDVALCRELGIAGLEICENKLARDPTAAAGQLRAVRDAGLRVSSVQARVHALFPDEMAPEPADPQARVDAFRRTMDLVATTLPEESPAYVLITGTAPRQDLGQARQTLFDSAGLLAREAAARGARIAFEPLHYVMMNRNTFVCLWEEAVTLVQALDLESLGLVCDLWNVWDQPDILAQVRQNIGRVAMVHVSDWRNGGPHRADDRLVPGRGIIPFAAWGEMFADAGYDGWIALEMLTDPSLPDSYRHEPLRDVLEESRRHLLDTGCLMPAVV